MKKITLKLSLILFVGALLVTSCSDDPIVTKAEENLYNEKGAIATISDVQGGFFNLLDKENSEISFELGEAGESVSSIDIFKSYNGGDRVLHASTNPGTVNVTFAEAVDGLGVTVDEVMVGDNFVFSFETTTSSGTWVSGRTLTIPASCPSNLGGTYSYVSTDLVASSPYAGDCPTDPVTGEVTFTDLGGGTYQVSDLGFGQYSSTCWSDMPATSGNATISDVCNKITSGGLDQYDLVYTWVITGVDGDKLSISWTNNYGDGGKTVLTNPNGDWPPLFTE